MFGAPAYDWIPTVRRPLWWCESRRRAMSRAFNWKLPSRTTLNRRRLLTAGAGTAGLAMAGVAYNIATYAIEPELAQKWEQASPTEYVFHLQPGVKWHNKPPSNGRAMTADDVLWSFKRAQTDDPRFNSRSLLAQIDKVEAPDRATIKITTKAPDASTFNKL